MEERDKEIERHIREALRLTGSLAGVRVKLKEALFWLRKSN